MGRRDIACGVTHSGLSLAAVALCLGLMAAPAATYATTLTVTGGPGLDQGQICTVGFCPGTPTFSLIGAASVAGSFVYNAGPQTVDFLITLTAPANFGPVQLLAGSSFSATGVPVVAVPFGAGILVGQLGGASALASPLLLSPAIPVLANTPAISGLICSIGTGSDQCGFSLGPTGLQFGPVGPATYEAFLTFNTNVVPVPAAVWLFGSAIGLMGVMRRRVAA